MASSWRLRILMAILSYMFVPSKTFLRPLSAKAVYSSSVLFSTTTTSGGAGSSGGRDNRSSPSSRVSSGGRGRGSSPSGRISRSGSGGRGLASSSSSSAGRTTTTVQDNGVRLNKCVPSLSRRAADDAIAEGRVTVNGEQAAAGYKVQPRDVVKLDGKVQYWQGAAAAKQQQPSKILEDRNFVYLKYWKGRGVTCTSDRNDKSNIINAGRFDLFPQRVFTVGRLDKDSTGLILLTSDGRVNQAMLSPATKKEKIYAVEFEKIPSDSQLEKLRSGVVITTEAQRDKTAKPMTAKTQPCRVTRLGGATSRKVEFVLTEGRNRQIRKMAEAVGLMVVNLHRTSFAGISLTGLKESNWMELSELEMETIQKAILASKAASNSDYDEEED